MLVIIMLQCQELRPSQGKDLMIRKGHRDGEICMLDIFPHPRQSVRAPELVTVTPSTLTQSCSSLSTQWDDLRVSLLLLQDVA